jgi:hypothetical protein
VGHHSLLPAGARDGGSGDVEDVHGITGGAEVARHGKAHPAESEEADILGHR